MAVSNAIGSNIFDILFGLGLPWLITTLAQDKKIEVAKDDLFVNVLFLYGVLVVYVGLIVWNKMQLNVQIGRVLIVLYLVFVVYTVIRTVVSGSNC